MITIDELGKIIKSLIISNPNTTTIEQLEREFRENEGYSIPRFQFFNTEDLLRRGLQNVVKLYGSGPKTIVMPIASQKSQHIQQMVLEQHNKPNKRQRIRSRPFIPRFHTNCITRAQGNCLSHHASNFGRATVQTGRTWTHSSRNSGVAYYMMSRKQPQAGISKSNFYVNQNLPKKHVGLNFEKSDWNTCNTSNNNLTTQNKCYELPKIQQNSNPTNNFIYKQQETYQKDLPKQENTDSAKSTNKNEPNQDESINFKCTATENEQENMETFQSNQQSTKFELEENNNSVVAEPTVSNSRLHALNTLIDYQAEIAEDTKIVDKLRVTFAERLQISEAYEHNLIENSEDASTQASEDNTLVFQESDDDDINDALPDFALNKRVFLCDFPKDAVGFGHKIEPFQMPENIQLDSTISIYIAEIHNAYRFWFHLANDESPLDDLQYNIQLFYNQSDVAVHYNFMPEFIQPGQLCIALYQDSWHRAEILTNVCDNKVKVYFVDYGTVSEAALNELKYLRAEFAKLPAMACRGSLYGIIPVRLHWCINSTIAFLTMSSNRRLHARICEIDEESKCYYLNICDTQTEEVININRELINMKLAVKCHEWIISKVYGDSRLRHKREDYPTFEMLEKAEYPSFAEIHSMKVNGIEYEEITDKLIYNPNVVKADHLNLNFILLESNPFKNDIINDLKNKYSMDGKENNPFLYD